MPYVLIGRFEWREDPDYRAIGPFEDPDEAKEFCNQLGLPGEWNVLPLSPVETAS